MGSVGVPAVAFDAVGSILVVAFMVTPAAIAYLLTHRLSRLILYSCGIGILAALTGYGLAMLLNTAIAVQWPQWRGYFSYSYFVLSPKGGWLWQAIQHNRRKTKLLFKCFWCNFWATPMIQIYSKRRSSIK
jgi:manganese/zinc/iron transport system permease protein